jgi:rhamnogalacturonyl hydrolase YesR
MQALVDAARWLAHVARIQSEDDPYEDERDYPAPGYLGAVRNEYDTKTGTWSLNGPVWHTGQAMRAVLIGWRRSGDDSLLDAARAMGEYVARNIVDTPGHPNHGLLLAYEGDNVTINNQTVAETLPGLFDLADATGEQRWIDLARAAGDFLLGGFNATEGLIADHYHVEEQRFIIDPDNVRQGRIILDDAALVTLSELTGDSRYRDTFLSMAERALREEDPPGNWIVFPPWHRDTERLHIRCSWWWGYPMLTAYDLTGDERFLQAGIRAAGWYLDHQNLDGGFYYSPLRSGRHGSFALATSGSAVSSIMWADLYARTGDETYRNAISRSLRFLAAAQFTQDCADPNMRGALWETLNVPDGSGCPGFRIRDIAPIFAVRAWDHLLDAGLMDDEIAPLDNAMPW